MKKQDNNWTKKRELDRLQITTNDGGGNLKLMEQKYQKEQRQRERAGEREKKIY